MFRVCLVVFSLPREVGDARRRGRGPSRRGREREGAGHEREVGKGVARLNNAEREGDARAAAAHGSAVSLGA